MVASVPAAAPRRPRLGCVKIFVDETRRASVIERKNGRAIGGLERAPAPSCGRAPRTVVQNRSSSRSATGATAARRANGSPQMTARSAAVHNAAPSSRADHAFLTRSRQAARGGLLGEVAGRGIEVGDGRPPAATPARPRRRGRRRQNGCGRNSRRRWPGIRRFTQCERLPNGLQCGDGVLTKLRPRGWQSRAASSAPHRPTFDGTHRRHYPSCACCAAFAIHCRGSGLAGD